MGSSNGAERISISQRLMMSSSACPYFSFASAVAMFGQLLRDSDFKGEATYDKVISLAKQGLDHDDKGYRREFVRLVEAVKGIQQEK